MNVMQGFTEFSIIDVLVWWHTLLDTFSVQFMLYSASYINILYNYTLHYFIELHTIYTPTHT